MNGRAHVKTNLYTMPLATMSAWLLTDNPGIALQVAAGWLLENIVNPDLDIEERTESERLFVELPIIGPTLGRAMSLLWQLLWLPYALAIHHRSALSHMPFLGTTLRVLYLWGVCHLVGRVFFDVHIPLDILSRSPGVFWGLALADVEHWLLDILHTHSQRRGG